MIAMAELTNPAGAKILIERPSANILHNIVPLKTSIYLHYVRYWATVEKE